MHDPMTRRFRFRAVLTLALATIAFGVTGCDSSDSDDAAGRVEVQIRTRSSASSTAGPSAKASSLQIGGTNGTLAISDIRLIVAEMELESEDDSAEFETGPRFFELPLDTSVVTPLAASEIPPGTYTDFEFEVEDVDLDDLDDDDEEDDYRTLRDTIRQSFPNWPDDASMVAVGTFTPTGGAPQSFTTYFEAEIEVETALDPPLEVRADGASRTLTIVLDPTQWFRNADGSVRNLADDDYSSTGNLVEFEAEFENGVVEIEIDDDDDGDDDDDNGDDD